MHCPSCSKEVEATAYGRCPLCGATVAAGAAESLDAAARRRASARGPDDEPPDRSCGTCLAIGIGVPALLACLGLISVGNKNHWTSDGPGMLVIMLGVLVTGGVAVSALGSWFLSFTRVGRFFADD